MLKKRIIPKFLLRGGRLVKGIRFEEPFREAGNPVSTARVYEAYGVDELLFLDIESNVDGRSTLPEIIEDLSDDVFMPVTAGGGVRRLEDVNALLRAGADKVCVNTIAVEDPEFVRSAARTFGDQCITVSVDYRLMPDNSRQVFTHGGRKPTGLDPFEFAKRMEGQNCGEILLCSIDRDGTRTGYDLELLAEATAALDVPVIASSGAGSLDHCIEALDTGVSAIAISTLFLFSDHSPIRVRSHLWSHGQPVRASRSSRS